MKSTDILEALNWRYAVKTFDASKKLSSEDLGTILESARLAPSSIGIEPWKFLVVNNPELRGKLRAAGYDQTKITDASHIVVIAARTDAAVLPDELIARTAKAQGKTTEELSQLHQMASGAIAGRSGETLELWLKSQTYIPLGIMIETAALLGIDACPMEGFDPAKVGEVLGLEAKNLKAVTMLAIGYRGDDAFASLPKTRRPYDEIVEVID
jgi:nitroreductase